jgi:type I restriction enzyme R subunit
MVFIFDECHRSQFGDNHKAIKEFFPNAQLFGFTGTPIFDENATYQMKRRRRSFYKTTQDILKSNYTLTPLHTPLTIEMYCVFILTISKKKGKQNPKPGEALPNRQ